MKFTIDFNHRDFFERNQYIEFDSLLSPADVEKWQGEIASAFQSRLDLSAEKFAKASPELLFQAGRDLWRANSGMRKLVTSKLLAKTASELLEVQPLRLGYDEYLPAPQTHHEKYAAQSIYHQILQEQATLRTTSCLQGVLCGLMICLQGGSDSSVPDSPIFSKKPGNAVYFMPDLQFDMAGLRENKESAYLLIVYTHKNTVYIFQNDDSHAHTLKEVGYVFGDRLNDKLNPIVYRS